ncbi:DUF2306 domain-containing protein [Actinocorallia populi]|uniref:DUF2306 domain-containing protein n=1 Tax=Actinocorallia populi TaxID=2079200 RepID=UPI000D0899BD|nr:DUF2306 domain-containing protein [Actinocorallia populi]
MTPHVPRTGSRTAGLWWLALSAAALAVFAPLPYLTAPLDELAAADSGLAADYAGRAPWLRAVFYVHVVGGGLALLLSPLQLSSRLRARTPKVHRACGRIVLSAIVLAGFAGLLMAPFNLAGPVGTAGFGSLALLWVGFAAAAYVTIRRRDVAAHRRWAVRLFALTYAGVTLRLWLIVLMALQPGTGPEAAFDRAYLLVPFLCWVPNLLVAERFHVRRAFEA